jgi:thiamine-monophosphate kinase
VPAPDEFELIRRLFAPLARHPGALGLTDDAALLDCPPGHRLVMTADAIVAGVHFLADDSPDLIARKLVRVNLSDLAAMGAAPMGLLLAACFPESASASWLEGFAAGLAADCQEFGVSLLGGDTVATPGPATFTITAVGTVETGRELRRSTARAGDRIWVSGTIGDGAFGLIAARGAATDLAPAEAAFLADRYRVPQPRIALGRALIGLATAAMDISDGLVGDLGHICATSGVGAAIEAGRVPLSPAAKAAVAAGLGHGIATVLTGGDDYELLFTAAPDADAKVAALESGLGLRLTAIGKIIAGADVRVDGPDGRPLELAHSGYRHFNP